MNFNHQAELLYKYRKLRKMSQSELGKALNQCAQISSNIERAKAGIPLKHAHRFIEVLNIPLHELKYAIKRDFEDHLNEVLGESTLKAPEVSICASEVLDAV